jgi:uncharacterized protein
LVRAVLDPGVLVAGVISSAGAPAALVRAWLNGAFELVVCADLLDELRRALGYPKVSSRVTPERAVTLLSSLERAALSFADPSDVPSVSRDPADDYLFALAHDADAVLVSGDRDVLEVPGPPVRVLTPKTFASLVSRLGA